MEESRQEMTRRKFMDLKKNVQSEGKQVKLPPPTVEDIYHQVLVNQAVIMETLLNSRLKLPSTGHEVLRRGLRLTENLVRRMQ